MKKAITSRLTPRYIVSAENIKTDVVLPLQQYQRFARLHDQLVEEHRVLTTQFEQVQGYCKQLTEENLALAASKHDVLPELSGRIFHYSPKRAKAHATWRRPNWLVLKDSIASVYGTLPKEYHRRLHQKLRDQRILVEENGVYRFTTDCSFANPSVAACIVEMGSRNGLDVWIDEDGVPLGRYIRGL